MIEIATTTGFGYTRIIGELRKLGIKKISRQTVRRILNEEGIEPSPNKTSECWDNFVKRHAETLWAVDFFSVQTVTKRGLERMYVLAFLCMETREMICSTSTEHPNSAWVSEQTTLFLDKIENREKQPAILMHDRDTKFSKEFTDTLKTRQVRTNVLPKASPNLNGRVERVIQTIKLECLEKFVIFGKKHLDFLVADFTEYYNTVRSSMPRKHLPPLLGEEPEEATMRFEQNPTLVVSSKVSNQKLRSDPGTTQLNER